MKILFDHCVPNPLRHRFPTHTIQTAAEMGWAELKNGALLAEAAKRFDLLLTVDKNIKNQQNVRALPIAVVVLNSLRNTPEALAAHVPFVEKVLLHLQPRQMIEIDSHGEITVVLPDIF